MKHVAHQQSQHLTSTYIYSRDLHCLGSFPGRNTESAKVERGACQPFSPSNVWETSECCLQIIISQFMNIRLFGQFMNIRLFGQFMNIRLFGQFMNIRLFGH
nr:hypothetical protein BgiMline_031289 [Biomphalaria glabrata]